MRVIHYKQGYFSPNVAIVAKLDKFQVPQLLTPTGLTSIIDNQWSTYWSAVRSNACLALTEDTVSAYSLFTIDLLAFKNLYVKIDNKVYDVFAGFDDLLEHAVANDMVANWVPGANAVDIPLLSGIDGQVVRVKYSAEQNLRNCLQNSDAASSRLINIAIYNPTGYDIVFMQRVNRLVYDTTVDNYLHDEATTVYCKTTYDTSDYNFVSKAIGQVFTIRKQDSMNITVKFESFGVTSVLLANGGLRQLEALEEILTVKESDNWLSIEFIYNANRTYYITANSLVYAEDNVPANSICISSSDMLAHAKAAGIITQGRYIRSLSKQYSYTIEDVVEHMTMRRLHMYKWIDANILNYYGYDAFGNKYSAAKHKNNSQFIGGLYKMQPVQTGNRDLTINTASISQLYLRYGNFENNFITYKVVDVAGTWPGVDVDIAEPFRLDKDLYDSSTVYDSVNRCFEGKDLPYIHNRQVDWSNHRYTFKTDRYNGKQFATVMLFLYGALDAQLNKTYMYETTKFVVLVHTVELKLDNLEAMHIVPVALPARLYKMPDAGHLTINMFANNDYCDVEPLPADYSLDLPVMILDD